MPAVFTYGLTPESYLTGELCSTIWVYSGSVFESKNSSFPGFAEGGLVPSSFLVALAVVLFLLIGAISPPGLLWQEALLSPAHVKAKGA